MLNLFPYLLLGLANKRKKPDHRGEDSMGRRVHQQEIGLPRERKEHSLGLH
jgi:hypothetical protein